MSGRPKTRLTQVTGWEKTPGLGRGAKQAVYKTRDGRYYVISAVGGKIIAVSQQISSKREREYVRGYGSQAGYVDKSESPYAGATSSGVSTVSGPSGEARYSGPASPVSTKADDKGKKDPGKVSGKSGQPVTVQKRERERQKDSKGTKKDDKSQKDPGKVSGKSTKSGPPSTRAQQKFEKKGKEKDKQGNKEPGKNRGKSGKGGQPVAQVSSTKAKDKGEYQSKIGTGKSHPSGPRSTNVAKLPAAKTEDKKGWGKVESKEPGKVSGKATRSGAAHHAREGKQKAASAPVGAKAQKEPGKHSGKRGQPIASQPRVRGEREKGKSGGKKEPGQVSGKSGDPLAQSQKPGSRDKGQREPGKPGGKSSSPGGAKSSPGGQKDTPGSTSGDMDERESSGAKESNWEDYKEATKSEIADDASRISETQSRLEQRTRESNFGGGSSAGYDLGQDYMPSTYEATEPADDNWDTAPDHPNWEALKDSYNWWSNTPMVDAGMDVLDVGDKYVREPVRDAVAGAVTSGLAASSRTGGAWGRISEFVTNQIEGNDVGWYERPAPRTANGPPTTGERVIGAFVGGMVAGDTARERANQSNWWNAIDLVGAIAGGLGALAGAKTGGWRGAMGISGPKGPGSPSGPKGSSPSGPKGSGSAWGSTPTNAEIAGVFDDRTSFSGKDGGDWPTGKDADSSPGTTSGTSTPGTTSGTPTLGQGSGLDDIDSIDVSGSDGSGKADAGGQWVKDKSSGDYEYRWDTAPPSKEHPSGPTWKQTGQRVPGPPSQFVEIPMFKEDAKGNWESYVSTVDVTDVRQQAGQFGDRYSWKEQKVYGDRPSGWSPDQPKESRWHLYEHKYDIEGRLTKERVRSVTVVPGRSGLEPKKSAAYYRSVRGTTPFGSSTPPLPEARTFGPITKEQHSRWERYTFDRVETGQNRPGPSGPPGAARPSGPSGPKVDISGTQSGTPISDGPTLGEWLGDKWEDIKSSAGYGKKQADPDPGWMRMPDTYGMESPNSIYGKEPGPGGFFLGDTKREEFFDSVIPKESPPGWERMPQDMQSIYEQLDREAGRLEFARARDRARVRAEARASGMSPQDAWNLAPPPGTRTPGRIEYAPGFPRDVRPGWERMPGDSPRADPPWSERMAEAQRRLDEEDRIMGWGQYEGRVAAPGPAGPSGPPAGRVSEPMSQGFQELYEQLDKEDRWHTAQRTGDRAVKEAAWRDARLDRGPQAPYTPPGRPGTPAEVPGTWHEPQNYDTYRDIGVAVAGGAAIASGIAMEAYDGRYNWEPGDFVSMPDLPGESVGMPRQGSGSPDSALGPQYGGSRSSATAEEGWMRAQSYNTGASYAGARSSVGTGQPRWEMRPVPTTIPESNWERWFGDISLPGSRGYGIAGYSEYRPGAPGWDRAVNGTPSPTGWVTAPYPFSGSRSTGRGGTNVNIEVWTTGQPGRSGLGGVGGVGAGGAGGLGGGSSSRSGGAPGAKLDEDSKVIAGGVSGQAAGLPGSPSRDRRDGQFNAASMVSDSVSSMLGFDSTPTVESPRWGGSTVGHGASPFARRRQGQATGHPGHPHSDSYDTNKYMDARTIRGLVRSVDSKMGAGQSKGQAVANAVTQLDAFRRSPQSDMDYQREKMWRRKLREREERSVTGFGTRPAAQRRRSLADLNARGADLFLGVSPGPARRSRRFDGGKSPW